MAMACAYPSRNRSGALGPRRRTGFIVVTMLIFIAGMVMLGAAFALNSSANLGATQANAHLVQARQAAEAGIHRVMHLLSDPINLADMTMWYDNRDDFYGAVVWSSYDGTSSFAQGVDVQEGVRVWRFSIVADDPDDDQSEIRYGITDETSKLNINTATKEQFQVLFNAVVAPLVTDELAEPEELVAALIDWRDADNDVTEGGAEQEYYQSLDTPYRCKNGYFDTIEELLLVKGFTANILFGEDMNRNGLLEPNEDDGEESVPENDNTDGELNRGLLPYITIYSWDRNSSNENIPRINLNDKDVDKLEEKLFEVLSPAAADFIVQQRRSNKVFKSRTELLTLEESPITEADMEEIMDKTTTVNWPYQVGAVNINTAPAVVLQSLGVFTEQEVDDIVGMRETIDPLAKATIAWPLLMQIIAEDRYEAYGKAELYLTARSVVYTVESIGFADHTGTYKRLQAVVEVIGPIGNIKYYRDLTVLGIGYPVRPQEEGLASFGSTGV